MMQAQDATGVATAALAVNMGRAAWDKIFGVDAAGVLAQAYNTTPPVAPPGSREPLLFGSPAAEVMITSWGAQAVDAAMLERFPALKLVIHGAGSIKSLVTPAAAARGVRFCSAAHINARPVAEFCLGVILCDLKRVLRFRGRFARAKDLNTAWWGTHNGFDGGYYRKKVGLVGWGAISRHLAGLLRNFDLEVHVCSRHLSEADRAAYKVQPATLEWIMEHCDVVSLHQADTPANHHQINAGNLRLMKPGSALINTARGGVVDEDALVAKLREGQVWAYLDVAQSEPPPAGHPFYTLENCVLTPHVSGSIGTETQRLGDYCLRELANHLSGKPLEHEMNLAELPNRA